MSASQSSSSAQAPPSDVEASRAKISEAKAQAFRHTLAKYDLNEDILQKIHDTFVEIAKDAGQIMKGAERKSLSSAAIKDNTTDLVTKYDKKIEEDARLRLHNVFPAIEFLGEETFGAGTVLSDKPTVVLDPIDGTLNFTRGVRYCAVSIALVLEKKPIIGVVYSPFEGELFTAIRGKGSHRTKMNDEGSVIEKVQLPLPEHYGRPMPNLKGCLLGFEWGHKREGPNWDLRTQVLIWLLAANGAMCKSIRTRGSCALDFCNVALGEFDAYWDCDAKVWDVAAGWCIVEEAGGIVASVNPGDWQPTMEGRVYFPIRKAEPEEQKAVVGEFWAHMGERRFQYGATGTLKDPEEQPKERKTWFSYFRASIW
ncbi:unnamed protein product [Periconia digitata]|uniref:Inositol-1-monophosphatase n=1 Tax=Periconia digitata TaxID=1303443 RepID=A0A9W4U449_9PLEO|nr:unnamed protein product [Periconia digitata]